MRKCIIKSLWIFSFSTVVTVAILFFLIWYGIIGYSPDIEHLQNPINKSASLIYSADGKVIGTYNMDRANRIPVSYSNISPHLVPVSYTHLTLPTNREV